MAGIRTMISRVRTGRNQITLARVLSKFGVASRTHARELIRKGRVTVGGRVIRSPDLWVDPSAVRIRLDGHALRREPFTYLLLNKPVGVVTTGRDELGRPTVADLIPTDPPHLFPVGRLDMETSGLLLVTNDTQFGEMITSPDSGIPKTYAVRLDKPLRDTDKERMEVKFELRGGVVLRPAVVRIDPRDRARCAIIVREGKNRQVRRMCEALGYRVLEMRRTHLGPLRLGALKEGSIRPLTPGEIAGLRSLRKKGSKP